MAMSVNPAIEGNQPLSSGHCDPAAMIGPRSTVPIRARGHVVPHQQAAHMTATGRTCTRAKALASRGPSTHDSQDGWAALATAGNVERYQKMQSASCVLADRTPDALGVGGHGQVGDAERSEGVEDCVHDGRCGGD